MVDDIDGEQQHGRFGWTMAMSSDGTVVAVGAPYKRGDTVDAGQARTYVETGGVWTQLGNDLNGSFEFFLIGPMGNPYSTFTSHAGKAVSLSGDRTVLAVGASRHVGHDLEFRLYRWSQNSWEVTEQMSGSSVAFSHNGTVMALGTELAGPHHPDLGYTGEVRVFRWDGTRWNPGTVILGWARGDQLGVSVALSADGTVLACGAAQEDISDGPGYVQLYRWIGAKWLSHGSLFGFDVNDRFGQSVSLSGDGGVVAIAASNWASGHNYVVVHQFGRHGWSQVGQSLSPAPKFVLSGDGDTVVIGDYLNDSNGINSGRAVVYRLSPNREEWVRVGQDLVGERANDQFGYSLSVSDDGNRIAIGAPRNETSPGYVRVFDLQ